VPISTYQNTIPTVPPPSPRWAADIRSRDEREQSVRDAIVVHGADWLRKMLSRLQANKIRDLSRGELIFALEDAEVAYLLGDPADRFFSTECASPMTGAVR
jgi:hypothetical protein